jgi:hypothetical protein
LLLAPLGSERDVQSNGDSHGSDLLLVVIGVRVMVRKPPCQRLPSRCFLGCVGEIVAGDDAVQLVLEPVERIALELAHPLARDAELLADRLE